MIIRRISPPSLASWSGLFNEFDRMRRDMDRLYQTTVRPNLAATGVYPLVNLSQDANNFYLRAEVPGVPIEKLELSVADNTISIAGSRDPIADGESIGYHRKEVPTGYFKRALTLPGEVANNQIEACCKDGVLTVTLPKSEKEKPRQIEIKAQ